MTGSPTGVLVEPGPLADFAQVISSDMCVGCGACVAAVPDAFTIQMTENGTYRPVLTGVDSLVQLSNEVLEKASAVCPFASNTNEDEIARDLFAGPGVESDPVSGYHRSIVAGHVRQGDFRDLGTSGGMTSWVLHELLERGEVDGVIHVSSTFGELPGPLSSYRISRTSAELLGGRKSRYHVQTLAEVMEEVRSEVGSYAVVGVPCFIKAVRLLSRQDPVIDERIRFAVSLVCGHYKSTLYSEYLAWSSGIPPVEVLDIDYRHKMPGRAPNRYSMKISERNGNDVTKGVEKIPMADWGLGVFKLGACDYCDDIVGETADISLGDAWLPPFMGDWKGANMAITRSELAERIVSDGIARGDLDVESWTAQDVAAAQTGAVRHRRAGLAVRLGNRARLGEWAPRKRVSPAAPEDMESEFARRMLYREAIAVASTPAYLEARGRGDLGHFRRVLRPLVQRYDGSRSATLWKRAAARMLGFLPPRAEALVRKVLRGIRFS